MHITKFGNVTDHTHSQTHSNPRRWIKGQCGRGYGLYIKNLSILRLLMLVMKNIKEGFSWLSWNHSVDSRPMSMAKDLEYQGQKQRAKAKSNNDHKHSGCGYKMSQHRLQFLKNA